MRENTGFVLHLHTQNDAKTWKASQIVINPLTKGLLVLICSAVSIAIYANLVNFEVYLKVPVPLDKMVKV